MEIQPVYKVLPGAMRWFNVRHSLPKTLISSISLLAGIRKPSADKPKTIFTFSVSEDLARLWYYFAKKKLDDQWHIIISDWSGEMRREMFPGADVVPFINFSHGAKIDIFVRRFINSEIVFLCDDDRYVVKDISKAVSQFDDPNVGAVSLRPRNWYKFAINGTIHDPMGSYAVMFRRSLILKNNLHFRSVKKDFKNRVFEPGVKAQAGYDTGDFVNEQLLLKGYQVITEGFQDSTSGFDGLTGPTIFLRRFGKDYVLASLALASHYKKGSLAGSQLRGLYGVAKADELYRTIFKTEPRYASGLTPQDVISVLTSNSHIALADRADHLAYFKEVDEVTRRLSF